MRRILVWLVVLAVLAGGGWLIFDRTTPDQTAARRAFGAPVPVLVTAATQRDVAVYLDGLGTVQAFNAVTVRPMIDGPLNQVLFKEGQDVTAGTVLAYIDPRPYQATLDQAIAKKAQDEATLANAKVDLARYVKLVATNYTSGQIADTQRALVAQTEAIVKQDQASIDSARTQLSYTTIAAPLSGRTGIRQVDQGNIIHASDTNGLVVITQLQPITVVFTLPQQSLAAVSAAMQAASHTDGATVLALPQGSLGAGATNDEDTGPGLAAVNPDAAPGKAADGSDAPVTPARPAILDRGSLAVLDNQVDSSTGTIKLKATFPNANLTLWPGGFVNVRLRVQTLQNVVTVPPVAVQRGPNGTYVYIATSDKTAQRRPVTVSHEDERVSVIASGLKPGEQVVIEGASRLTDGARITLPDESAAPAAGAPAPRQHRRQPAGAAGAADARPADGRGT